MEREVEGDRGGLDGDRGDLDGQCRGRPEREKFRLDQDG